MLKARNGIFWLRSVALIPCTLAALYITSAGAVVPLPTSVERLPYVDNPDPSLRDEPFLAWHEDLSEVGYVEREYLFTGTGNEYIYVDDANQSPEVAVKPNTAGEFTSRIIIRRPNRPSAFNGVVYLEILNATAKYDNAPHWNLTYESIIEDGAAYVGVTYSPLSAEFMTDWWGVAHTDYEGCAGNNSDPHPAPCGSEARNNSRYFDGSNPKLNIPTLAYTWDILNQAAALVRADDWTKSPFYNFPVEAIIAVGYSQSARFVTTFGNSFYPSYSEKTCTPEQEALGECTVPLVNGFIVAAGGPNASHADGAGFHPVGDRRNCENAVNRVVDCVETATEPTDPDPVTDNLPKFMRFTTESDIKSARVRQDFGVANVADYDQPYLRTYEAAGTSHVDFWGTVVNRRVGEYQFGIPADPNPSSGCDNPMNPIRTGIPLSAVQHRLAKWITDDELPPPNYFMEYEGSFPNVSWIRDADGNAIGGVKPPRLAVPLGSYNGINPLSGPFSVQTIFCTTIIGGFETFTPEEIANRYGTRGNFAALTWWSSFASYLDGFLLPVDARTIIEEAKNYEGLPE